MSRETVIYSLFLIQKVLLFACGSCILLLFLSIFSTAQKKICEDGQGEGDDEKKQTKNQKFAIELCF